MRAAVQYRDSGKTDVEWPGRSETVTAFFVERQLSFGADVQGAI